LIYFCNRVCGELTTSVETSSVKYFGINNLPELSTKRNTTKQIKECFENRTNHTIIE
ncbi:ADP-ribose pyrophosphatase, partial [Mammaliicoccus sciuri]